METHQDRLLLLVVGFATVMLLSVLFGDWIPVLWQSIIYATAIMGVFTVLVLRNIISDSRGILIWRLFALGMLILFVIILSIILLDPRFEPGDPLLLGMQPATAIMVFGTSLFPFWFLILWVIGFRRAIVPQEREDHLNELKSDKLGSGDSDHG